jgi:NAD+ kinase
MTKKQLSDMVWNVRTLAKRLGHLKQKLNIRSVFVLTKPDHCVVKLTRELVKWLLARDSEADYLVYVEEKLKDNADFDAAGLYQEEPSAEARLKYLNLEALGHKPHSIDFIISLGGDGTVLYSSWLFQRVAPPVLSFALGSLGFLTKFNFDHHKETLQAAFRDGISISVRLRLECTIMRRRPHPDVPDDQMDLVKELVGAKSKHDLTHAPERTFQVLNEIIVDRGPNPSTHSPCL